MLDFPHNSVVPELARAFGASNVRTETTADGIDTCWIPAALLPRAAAFAKTEVDDPFPLLFDLTAIDERGRDEGGGFSLVVHLSSLVRNRDLRLKVEVPFEEPRVPTLTDVWAAANWYEREVWDMFGVRFDGHPDLRRILMPATWNGHPLRRNHPARATEMGRPDFTPERRDEEERALATPELEAKAERTETMVLNVGPQHPGTHGVLRIVLRLDGETIVEAQPEIGFHHRGAEKMAERQTWHTFIPYTDRVDYLAGVLNNHPYVMAVEKLCGIEVPERAEVIRIMMSELFRIASHLVWFGTFAQDVGAFSPVFYMFTDRERIFDIVEAICGGRMHPNWFRIGGVAQDLPEGWDGMVRDFLDYMPTRLDEYDDMVMRNAIFQARTRGIGAYDRDEALEWGVTGPGLRACGEAWDLRKARPYGMYDDFDFDVPTASSGDAFARAVVRVEEMRQSLRIVEQCVRRMPDGPVKAEHPQAVPPPRERMLEDIETLIQHFLAVSWGPVVPAGEASVAVESAKGICAYYLTSSGDIHPYRARIRAPSFPHLQMLSEIAKGETIADLMSILGSIDFVLADCDR